MTLFSQARASWPTALNPVSLAILCMGFAALLSSCLHVGVRIVASHGMPTAEIVFLRTLLTIAFTAPLVFRPSRMSWRTPVPHLHLLRGAVGTLSMWMWYYALSHMPLGDAATLGQTTMLFVVLGAALWFRERVGTARWLALAIGIAGAVIVLRPSAGSFGFAPFCALAASLLWATSMLMSKAISRHDSPLTITFYQPLTIAPLALLIAIPTWVMPSLSDLGLMTIMAGTAGLANFCTIKALAIADASITAPIDYTKLLWTTLAAFVMFGEVPGLHTWIGAGLIVLASLLVVVSQRSK